jgi:hypothetical protein
MPLLQARLVGILNALGQGINQPAGYPVDSLNAAYLNASLGDLAHLPAYPAASFAQLHQAIPLQPACSGLNMSQMLDQFSALGLNSSIPAYSRVNGQNYMPGSFQLPAGGFQLGPPSALPPEHIAAWQAAWLSQPLSASSHAFQG